MSKVICLLAVLVVVGGFSASAQTETDLRGRAQQKLAEADSLRSLWDILWKKSDSMRIESMLFRIKSNVLQKESASLLKEAQRLQQIAQSEAAFIGPQQGIAEPSPEPVDGEMLADMKHMEHLRKQQVIATDGNVRSGKTLSDSGTAMVLRLEPDTGMASYYGAKFHGRKTASGETFNMYAHTCAHRWLPFGTLLQVTNLSNGKHVIVTVNDRGPFHHGRMIDISKQAAEDIGMINSGTARVSVEVVE